MKVIQILIAMINMVVIIFVTDFVTSRKLLNRYKMYGIFGKPGSGKSTFLNKIAYQHIQKKWIVFTDDPTTKIEGIYHFDSQKLKEGKWLPDGRKGQIGPNGHINKKDYNIVLIFDEIGSLYNNRDFKNNLTPETLKWWKEHRHRRIKIYYGSQSYKDMDLKIRNLSDQLFLVKRGILKNFSVAKPILINMDIDNGKDGQGEGGGRIVENYKYDLIFFWKFIFLRKWIKKFDSYR